MENEKLINLLDNKPSQSSKFRTKIWVGVNDDARGTYNANSQIKFKTSMLNSSLCDYSDAYTLVKGTMSTAPVPPPTLNSNNNNKEVVFKIFSPFIDCISEINNTQIHHAKDIDLVMATYNLLEYGNNYSKTLGSLWQ